MQNWGKDICINFLYINAAICLKDEEITKILKGVNDEEAIIEAKVAQVLEAVTKKPGKTKRPASGADQTSPDREPSPPGPPVYR